MSSSPENYKLNFVLLNYTIIYIIFQVLFNIFYNFLIFILEIVIFNVLCQHTQKYIDEFLGSF